MLSSATSFITKRPLQADNLEKHFNQLLLFRWFVLHLSLYAKTACTNESTIMGIRAFALYEDSVVKLTQLSVHLTPLQHLVPHSREIRAILESIVAVIDKLNTLHQ